MAGGVWERHVGVVRAAESGDADAAQRIRTRAERYRAGHLEKAILFLPYGVAIGIGGVYVAFTLLGLV